ncbi:hypothetical protein BLS_006629 [Venturia inaequalis]|uniref:Peptidase S54 rhomboid domain-containing protein n=1 Tax=Venturia inaequalis TaxID=5025 RepID=A0A8H3VF43_VENIN|nr:hypothetical protein BLS_006629 [Venturia inaequalis]KAE9988139.1 hypothetical protein EG327_003461 [Venturia inaequalis]KAE9988877.1 hypothetical protein EG328_005587 [Venturia inaequalis]
MNMSLRRVQVCFTARGFLPLSSPLHHVQRTGQIPQQLRAFRITSALANQRRPPTHPQYLPASKKKKVEQHVEAIDAEILRSVQARFGRREIQKQGLLYALYVANAAVFIAWTYSTMMAQRKDATAARKAREWEDFMQSNFTRSEKNRWWTNLTSAISHQNIIHFAVNMYAMRNAGSYIVVGMPQVGLLSFATLCVGSTLAAGAGAQLSNRLTGDSRGSLGASGMLCGILSTATCAYPAELGMITALWFCFDLGVLSTGNAAFSPLAHGAHLGGTLFGLVYYLVAIRRGKFPWRR